MRQLVLAGLGDHVARKISTQGLSVEEKKILRYAYEVTSTISCNIILTTPLAPYTMEIASALDYAAP